MFFKKTVAYCLTILVLLVPIFISVQTAIAPVSADEVAGPEVQGYGVKPSAFEYAGYKFVPWDLGDKVQPFDIPEYMQRANDNNDNAFSRAVRSCSAAGFPYIMVIDTYKCVGDSSIYDKSGMTYIYAFKSIPTFTMVEVGTGNFIYKSSPITQTYRKYHVKDDELCSSNNYASYGYFEDGYSNLGKYDCEASTESPKFICIAENFSGIRFQSGTVSINYYKNSGRAINFFSNFDPQIEGIDFDGGQAVKDSIFNGQHTGSVIATTSLSGSIDTATTKDFTVSVKNGRSDSIQYVLYITSSATINSSDISTTYQAYKWCYQTYQSCRVYRGSIAQTVVDKTADFLDILGERVPLSSATTIPLYMLLKKIGDSQVLGVYTSSYLSCPYHFLSSGNLDDLSFSISELPLSDGGQTYYLTVVCRDTTVQEVSAHHRATYSYCYYDDISQFSSYDVVLSESFSLTKNVYVAPSLNDKGQQIDKDGNVIKDSSGNPISSSKNYSQDIISLKQGNTASDAFATGGSASAQGGSAEVVNNPTFNNNPSVVVNAGGSGSGGSGGTVQDFDDVDTTTFQNLWDSCGNFFSFVKKVWSTFPLQASLVSGVFVVLFVLRIARR